MPVFTSTPTSFRLRRGPRSPSASVHPATLVAPDTTPDAVATAAAPGVSPESESIVLKARRAYDRDRQRVKKRKERAERERERNASTASTTTTGTADTDPRHVRDTSGRRAGGARGGTVKPRLELGGHREEMIQPDAYPKSPQLEVQEIIADVVERAAHARGEPLEVRLDQLVKPGKARKTKAGEFELVPTMPVVIALDDHMPEDVEFDEPWEHISADELDEKRVQPPSYATIVANAL